MSTQYNITKSSVKVFNKDKCVIHLYFCSGLLDEDEDEDSGLDDFDTYKNNLIRADELSPSEKKQTQILTERITKDHPELWLMMKKGDLIENTCISGYRAEGRFYIDDADNKKTNNLSINILYTKYDDYGTTPPHFSTITNFPRGYFDEENIIINDTIVKTMDINKRYKSKLSEWHCLDVYPIFIDAKRFKLNTVTPDDIFIDYHEDQKYDYVCTYVIVKFKKVNYCFLLSVSINKENKKEKDHKIKEMIDFMINTFKKDTIIFENSSCGVDEIIEKIKNEHQVEEENIFCPFYYE